MEYCTDCHRRKRTDVGLRCRQCQGKYASAVGRGTREADVPEETGNCTRCGARKLTAQGLICQRCAQATGRTPTARARSALSNTLPLGTRRNSLGYIFIRTETGWEREHRIVRGLDPDDPRVVHHINGDRTDNRLENLQILSRGTHSAHHSKGRILTDETRAKQRAYALSPEGNAVKRRAGRKGGGSNRNPVTVEEVVTLKEQGQTLAQMSATLDVGVKTIRNRLNEATTGHTLGWRGDD